MLTRRKNKQSNKIYYAASFIYKCNALVSPNCIKHCNDLDQIQPGGKEYFYTANKLCQCTLQMISQEIYMK